MKLFTVYFPNAINDTTIFLIKSKNKPTKTEVKKIIKNKYTAIIIEDLGNDIKINEVKETQCVLLELT